MKVLIALFGILLPATLLAEPARAPLIPILVGTSHESAAISVVVDRGLRSSKRLPTQALRDAREAMHAGEQIAADDLRALAMARDGLAAQRFIRAVQAGEAKATASDTAYIASVAVGSGRVWTLRTMVRAMQKLDPKTEPRARINAYIRVLYPHAWAGNALALEALVLFNGDGRLFGPLSDATRTRILAQAEKQGDRVTELRLAMGILEGAQGRTDPQKLAQARDYLTLAVTSEHLAVRTTAQNLLRLIEET